MPRVMPDSSARRRCSGGGWRVSSRERWGRPVVCGEGASRSHRAGGLAASFGGKGLRRSDMEVTLRLVVDRRTLGALFEPHPDIEITVVLGRGSEALRAIDLLRPD